MTQQELELRGRVVSAARSWLGTKQGSPEHKRIVDLYNSHRPLARGYPLKYTDAWCSGFVSAVAIGTGMTHIIPTEVGCEEHIKLFKAMGSWVEDDGYRPEPGDIIFYDWQDSGKGDNRGYADHVGIVANVNGDAITVIEGNKGGQVAARRIAVGGKYIRGYGVPDYESAAIEFVPDTPQPWYKETWDRATALGLVDGTRPLQAISRAEAAVIALRVLDKVQTHTEALSRAGEER